MQILRHSLKDTCPELLFPPPEKWQRWVQPWDMCIEDGRAVLLALDHLPLSYLS